MNSLIIPEFPTFKKLTLDDKDEIENFTAKFPQYSDYYFTSLWIYNIDDLIEISILNNNLVVKFQDYLTKEHFYSFLGDNDVLRTADTLLNFIKNNNEQPYLKLIPELVIESSNLWPEKYKVEEDIANNDYIISTDMLSKLIEPEYTRKKHLIDRFITKFPGYNIKLLDLTDKNTQDEITNLFQNWVNNSMKTDSDTIIELTAINRLFSSIEHFKMYTLGIYIDTHLVAFNIYEITNGNYGISSFQKADKTYEGIYAMLNYEVAKHLHSLNCEFVNYEQDLGIEGLRSTKISFHPVKYLKKYIVTEK